MKSSQQWLKDNATSDRTKFHHIDYSGRAVPEFHRSSLYTCSHPRCTSPLTVWLESVATAPYRVKHENRLPEVLCSIDIAAKRFERHNSQANRTNHTIQKFLVATPKSSLLLTRKCPFQKTLHSHAKSLPNRAASSPHLIPTD